MVCEELLEREGAKGIGDQIGMAEVKVPRDGIGDGDGEDPGGLCGGDAVGGVLKRDGFVGLDVEGLKGELIGSGVRLVARRIFGTDDGGEVLEDAAAFQVPIDPGMMRGGSDGEFEVAGAGVGEKFRDAGAERRCAQDFGFAPAAECAEGVESKARGGMGDESVVGVKVADGLAEGGVPGVEGEGTSVRGVEFLPALEGGGFRVEDEAVEVEDEGADGHRRKLRGGSRKGKGSEAGAIAKIASLWRLAAFLLRRTREMEVPECRTRECR
jgi:hypothetical protein